ncbi:MAG TPA: hypothetical protein VFA75_06390 [Nevskia sp.]|nr:hypothetical protein [Nevskia sp.]
MNQINGQALASATYCVFYINKPLDIGVPVLTSNRLKGNLTPQGNRLIRSPFPKPFSPAEAG